MEITKRRLADIVPYAGNAKKHDKRQINNVAESIKQYGFVQPIVVDRDGVIVIGHCRALAAKKLGMEEVPCVCVDDLTPEQVNALRLVDNKSNESDWDFDLLADELPGLDLSAFDFDFSFPEMDESEIEEMTNEQREQESGKGWSVESFQTMTRTTKLSLKSSRRRKQRTIATHQKIFTM